MCKKFLLLAISGLVFLLNANSVFAQKEVGIDVSHHQKTIDWSKVANENVAFVYIKATEGATYVDPKFHENAKGASKAGILIGAYHYFRMTSGATAQFNNFKRAMEKHSIDLIPMIDVETNDKKPRKVLQDSLDVFISLVKKHYGVMPMIYGTQRSYNELCAPKYNKLHLYIGRYGPNAPVIIGKGTYTIWQYTENGKVNGINKPVDKCKFNPRYSLQDIRMNTNKSSK